MHMLFSLLPISWKAVLIKLLELHEENIESEYSLLLVYGRIASFNHVYSGCQFLPNYIPVLIRNPAPAYPIITWHRICAR